MNELDLQGGYLVNFLCNREDGLQYNEVSANTISQKNYIIEEDLKEFLANTTFNKVNYKKLLRKYNNNETLLLEEIVVFLLERVKSSANMALFFNMNRNFVFQGLSFILYAPSGSELEGDDDYKQNVFSVVQELTFKYKHEGKQIFSFRPDITFFLNGFYFGYSELKSNWNNQSARKNGCAKVRNDYKVAVKEYLKIAKDNDFSKTIRRNFLFPFEKAIHITTTDINNTYVLRNIATLFDSLKNITSENHTDEEYDRSLLKQFKSYPLTDKTVSMTERFEEVFNALYSKSMIEKEILYYNFLERELVADKKGRNKTYKHNDGRLISPRPKQKFGSDKIIKKIDEFLEHEQEPNYFINKLEEELRIKGVGETRVKELVDKRLKYQNNKNVYSLLLQYAAGFGKSNIIGWTALQLKDLRDENHQFVYDKIMIVVDRLQLRDQLDTMLHNMNIQKGMFIEAYDKKSFKTALTKSERIIVVNIQKFSTLNPKDNTLTNEFISEEALAKMAQMRVCFIIDEVHRSNAGDQHADMISLFDELQSSFDNDEKYKSTRLKKNLIVGFTATPSDHTLARFGEYNRYAESEKLWVPFDSYTMREAIEDGYILNPIRGIVPVSAKMYFRLPDNELEGFEGDTGYYTESAPEQQVAAEVGKHYCISKGKIYSNDERILAIGHFIVDRLISAVYHNIRGTAKAMLAVSSIPDAIKYKRIIDRYYPQAISQYKKHERFKDAPVYIVYSDRQGVESASSLNDGLSEKQVLQNFKLCKNGLIIVVDKLQTGFDEPKLHTLFLDKEIRGINAVQTISRVNRTCKDKNDCKIIDFSHLNVNVESIKKAFEHFSNVVVSDFNPLEDEKVLNSLYLDLSKHDVFISEFKKYKKYWNVKDSSEQVVEIENFFRSYVLNNAEKAHELRAKVCNYFKILNLIEYVIEIDKKFSEEIFVDFWYRYNVIYRLCRQGDAPEVDDVEIYFDNKIGILAPIEPETDTSSGGSSKPSSDRKYKYDILAEIERRNRLEKDIEQNIVAFEKQIDGLFDFIIDNENGKRLIAKIKTTGTAFDYIEKLDDFMKLYRQYTILHKSKLNDFFLKETKDSLIQLYDAFEKSVMS